MDEVKAVVYDGSSVTSPKNWNNPHPGDPCYSLHTDSRNYVVIGVDLYNQSLTEEVSKIVGGTDMEGRKYVLRRLTPTECARLQGFPDWWTDGVEGSDSAQYRMWGNGIALPCAVDVLARIVMEANRHEERV